MQKGGNPVAQYWTELAPKKELEKKFHLTLEEAREGFERKKSMKKSPFKMNKIHFEIRIK